MDICSYITKDIKFQLGSYALPPRDPKRTCFALSHTLDVAHNATLQSHSSSVEIAKNVMLHNEHIVTAVLSKQPFECLTLWC